MHRGMDPQRVESGRHVVDLSVADDDGAGDPGGRQIGDAAGERGEQARAPAVAGLAGRIVAAMDDPQFQAGNVLDPLFHLGQGSRRLRLAWRHVLALRIVDHDDGDIAQIVAVFLHGGGVRQGAENRCQRQQAP